MNYLSQYERLRIGKPGLKLTDHYWVKETQKEADELYAELLERDDLYCAAVSQMQRGTDWV